MLQSRITNLARWFVVVFVLTVWAGPLFALQETSNPAGQTTQQIQPQSGGIAKDFSEWTDQGGWVMYPIYIDFILGLGILVYLVVRVYFDKHRAKATQQYVAMKLTEPVEDHGERARVEEILAEVVKDTKSSLGKLFAKLCELWRRDPSAEALQVEIKGELETQKEGYELGRNFAVLLSDTAGALGLLGTVLGMYETFMPGRLDSSQVIYGMGVALVTTIGGLIVSIFLNFGISYAQAVYLSHLSAIEEAADQFRYIFGKGQSAAVAATAAPQIIHVPMPAAMPAPNVEVKMPSGQQVPSNLRILSGNRQVAEAGMTLPKALEVALEDEHGNPISNFPVVFEANGSLITFDNGEAMKQTATNSVGIAKVHARMGKLIGNHKIVARINGKARLQQEFELECRPGAPDKLVVLSGHLLNGKAGAVAPEPLSLRLEDAAGNPVPGQSVVFEVAYNNGRLERDKARVEVSTDEEGVASANFRFSENAGANIVKAVVKSKTTHKLETAFESMALE
ncbi:MotA/TolQ/ExbB proton channel family protein [candidate division KSB1 bacterium]|nr:MotA/TolQ/ExbB proton channel family protein [candidate division KSB1 bacterium]